MSERASERSEPEPPPPPPTLGCPRSDRAACELGQGEPFNAHTTVRRANQRGEGRAGEAWREGGHAVGAVCGEAGEVGEGGEDVDELLGVGRRCRSGVGILTPASPQLTARAGVRVP